MKYTQVRERKLKNGFASLYLDTIYRGFRHTQTLPFVVKQKAKGVDAMEKRELYEKAEAIGMKKDLELQQNEYDFEHSSKRNYDFFLFAEDYIKQHQEVVDIRLYKASINKFKTFLRKDHLPCSQLTENILETFNLYLLKNMGGETPLNYMKKLKRIIKAATKEKYFKSNPAENIRGKKNPTKEKDVLSYDDLKMLWNTSCRNDQVKKAFLFSCFTGLRFCDVVSLRGEHIKNGEVHIVQSKTQWKVEIPLSQDALGILPTLHKESKVFNLPSHPTCLEIVKAWVKDAKVEKKISWHCARHSFGTNLIIHGNDVAITSRLLGHKSLTHTNRYLRVAITLKEKAIQNLPTITK